MFSLFNHRSISDRFSLLKRALKASSMRLTRKHTQAGIKYYIEVDDPHLDSEMEHSIRNYYQHLYWCYKGLVRDNLNIADLEYKRKLLHNCKNSTSRKEALARKYTSR